MNRVGEREYGGRTSIRQHAKEIGLVGRAEQNRESWLGHIFGIGILGDLITWTWRMFSLLMTETFFAFAGTIEVFTRHKFGPQYYSALSYWRLPIFMWIMMMWFKPSAIRPSEIEGFLWPYIPFAYFFLVFWHRQEAKRRYRVTPPELQDSPQWWGDSRLMRFLPEKVTGFVDNWVEPLGISAVGLMIYFFDPAVGSWLMICGILIFLRRAWEWRVFKNDSDVQDALTAERRRMEDAAARAKEAEERERDKRGF